MLLWTGVHEAVVDKGDLKHLHVVWSCVMNASFQATQRFLCEYYQTYPAILPPIYKLSTFPCNLDSREQPFDVILIMFIHYLRAVHLYLLSHLTTLI